MIIITTVDNKKLELLNMYIDGLDYNTIFKKIDDFIGNPFFLFDSSFRLLATSYKNKINGKFLIEFNKKYILSDEIFKVLNESGDLEQIKNSNDIVVKNFVSFKNPVMFKRIYDDKYTYGYMCIYAKNKQFEPEDNQLLDLICKIITHIINKDGYNYKTELIVFNQIIDGILVDKDEIIRILSNLNLNKKENKRVIVIETSVLQQIYMYLTNKYSDDYIFVHGNNIVYITKDSRDTINKNLKAILKDINDESIQIGVSNAFDDYVDLAKYYKEALDSINIGKKFIKNSNIHFNEDYRALSLINKLSNEEIMSIIDPRVKEILDYDKENKSNYLNDIETYFKSGRNINKASKMLFIHKNSMYYRIDKIKELFKLDLENENDCFNIELSLKLLKLLESEDK